MNDRSYISDYLSPFSGICAITPVNVFKIFIHKNYTIFTGIQTIALSPVDRKESQL